MISNNQNQKTNGIFAIFNEDNEEELSHRFDDRICASRKIWAFNKPQHIHLCTIK